MRIDYKLWSGIEPGAATGHERCAGSLSPEARRCAAGLGPCLDCRAAANAGCDWHETSAAALSCAPYMQVPQKLHQFWAALQIIIPSITLSVLSDPRMGCAADSGYSIASSVLGCPAVY